jgi:uncharacterized protein YkwD
MLRRSVVLVTLLAALLAVAAGCGVRRAAAPAPSGGGWSWQHEMMAEVNEWRRANGVGPLLWCGTLSNGAQAHTQYQANINRMTHSNLGALARDFGYHGWTALGENVAYGYGSVRDVLHGWLNSPGHRANILRSDFQHVGLGRAASASGTQYWTQDFGRSGTC